VTIFYVVVCVAISFLFLSIYSVYIFNPGTRLAHFHVSNIVTSHYAASVKGE